MGDFPADSPRSSSPRGQAGRAGDGSTRELRPREAMRGRTKTGSFDRTRSRVNHAPRSTR